MKNTRTMLIAMLLLITTAIYAQSPQSFNYQTVVRNNTGSILPNQNVSFRFTIHDVSATGASVYQETQALTTNSLGLISCAIGSGTVVSGTFSGIVWGGGAKYLQVEIDATGGSNYTSMGASQLLSVPYALYAANAGGIGTGSSSGTTNYVAKFTNDTTLGNSIIYDNGISVGIGTASPAYTLDIYSASSSPVAIHTGSNNSKGIQFYENGNYRGYFGSFTGGQADMDFGSDGASGGNSNIVTRGVARVVVDTIGRVGIGTMAPNTSLHVVSTSSGNPVIIDGAAGMYVALLEGGIYRGYMGSYSGNAADVDFGTGSFTNGFTHIVTRATPRLTIDTVGNAGIGTMSPLARLDVQSAGGLTAPQARLYNTNTVDYARLRFQNLSTKVWDIAAISDATDSLSLVNFYYYNGSTGNNMMTLTGNGKLGMGLTPSFKLDVADASGAGAVRGTSPSYGVFGQSTAASASAGIYPNAGVLGLGNGNSDAFYGYGSAANSKTAEFINVAVGGVAVRAAVTGSTGVALQIEGPIKVAGTNKAAYIHQCTASNTSADNTVLAYANPASTDIVMVTHNYNPNAVLLNIPIGVYWNGSAWAIYREDQGTMPTNATFNVLVIKQ